MLNTNNVYSWKVFDSFVRTACNHKPKPKWGSHHVLDVVASDLRTGDLQRRDKRGHPIEPWLLPSHLAKCYLLPAEVNARPIMKRWLLTWNPEQEKPRQLTPQQEVKKFGWKGALQLEAARIRASYKAGGGRVIGTYLATLVHAYAVKNNITTDGVLIPSGAYIRSHVTSKKAMETFTT